MRKICVFILLVPLFAMLFSSGCLAENEDHYDIFEMQKLEEYGDMRGIFQKVSEGDISGALENLDIKKLFVRGLKDNADIMRSLIIICLVSGIVRTLELGSGDAGLVAAHILSAGLCLKVLKNQMLLLKDFSDIFLAFSSAAVPVAATVLAVSGNAVLSGGAGLMYGACTAAAAAVKLLVIPCVAFYAVCKTVNCLAPRGMLTRLSKLIYGTVTVGMRASGIVLCSVLALQKTAAAGADSLARKATVSAVKAVPVVGDVFAAGADGVMAMLTGVKNSFGAAVIILMLINSIAPLTNLLASAFMFRITAALTEPVGDKSICGIIDGAGDAAMLMFTAGLCLMLMFVGGAAVLLMGTA